MQSWRAIIVSAAGAVAIVSVIVAIVLLASDNGAGTPPPTPAATSTAVPARLGVAVDLRSAPSSRVAIVAKLEAGSGVTVTGRDDSGDWLLIEVTGEPGLRGWVPRNAVIGAPDIEDLAVLASTPTATAVPTATLVPALPDLVVALAEARDNQLVVTLANEGTADVSGTILISLNGATPKPIDVKAGEPLLAGDELELRYEEEYVQRRGRVTIEASIDPPVEELDNANNRLQIVIEPDVPNDLGITNALLIQGRGLVVSVRNNSTIPIVGLIAIDVRQRPEGTLLGRRRLEVELLPEEIIEVEFEALDELDFTRATIQLASDALDDAQFANNTFPR